MRNMLASRVVSAYRRSTPRDLFSGPAAALAVGLLMAAYIAGYAWSAPNTDSADELLRAYEIRHALAFPLQGPPLGNVLHLGPVWFYLTALPLFAWHSWLSAALFIGFVCSLKFPLAYWCGRRLMDEDFGVLWAAALFLPGWTTVEQLVFLNPNGVAMALLACLAIALPGLQGPAGLGRCFALGLALALAIHVHPTALPAYLLAPAVLWTRWRHRASVLAGILALGAGFALPFVPYAVHQALTGFPDWASASGYVAKQVFVANIVNMPQVIAAYVATGPQVMASFLLEWSPEAAQALGWTIAGLAALSLAAVAAGSVARLRLVQFAFALVLIAGWIAIARPTTPVQFTWALAVPVSGLVALGLWSAARATRLLAPVVLLAVAAGFAVNVMVVRALAGMVRDGEGRLPSLIMDIKGGLPETVYRDVWFPAHAHDDLGEALCAAAPLQLHGHLAYVVDKDLGLDMLLACRDRSRYALAGSAGRHAFGMTRPFWRALSAAPDCWIGSLGLSAGSTPLVAREPIALADGATYLPRKGGTHPLADATLEFAAPADRAVLFTNVLGGYEHFEITAATANGAPTRPLASNDLSALYRAPAGSAGSVRWRITARSTRPDAIDVVAVAPRAGNSRPAATCLKP
jgi:hypothetical protein